MRAPPFDELPIFYHKKIWLTSEQFFYKIDCTTKTILIIKYAGVAQLDDEADCSQCERKGSRREEEIQSAATLQGRRATIFLMEAQRSCHRILCRQKK